MNLKGDRDLSQKSGFTRRSYPPGMHGQKRRRAKSEYGTQLLEKQKVKWLYGILERQFRRYIQEAEKHTGVTGQMLVRRLEGRLDNVVYRLGLAVSRSAARQLVGHGHITINGRKVTVPSYQVRTQDVIGIRPGSRAKKIFGDTAQRLKPYAPPSWLTLDKENLEGTVTGLPTVEEAAIPADIQKIVEFYSR